LKAQVKDDNPQENQEITILTIKKARTQFTLFIEVKEKLPNKDLQN
jgi:hypothetical protein